MVVWLGWLYGCMVEIPGVIGLFFRQGFRKRNMDGLFFKKREATSSRAKTI
jgi:hypothetical protein